MQLNELQISEFFRHYFQLSSPLSILRVVMYHVRRVEDGDEAAQYPM